jgi:copper(I)-binding protein
MALAFFLLLCGTEAVVEAQAQTRGQQKAQAQALVQDAWARPTVQGQTVGGGYFRIHGGATNDRLLGASADIAQSVELHTMRMDGDVMRMRQLDSVEVPAKQTVEFKPGGMHLMLIGLKTPLKVGNSFPMTLRFEKAGPVSVNVRVLPAPPSAEHKH